MVEFRNKPRKTIRRDIDGKILRHVRRRLELRSGGSDETARIARGELVGLEDFRMDWAPYKFLIAGTKEHEHAIRDVCEGEYFGSAMGAVWHSEQMFLRQYRHFPPEISKYRIFLELESGSVEIAPELFARYKRLRSV